MASNSNNQAPSSNLSAAVNSSLQIEPGNQKFMAEPDMKDERSKIWKTQVLVPSSKPNNHAFVGPIPDQHIDDELIQGIFLATINIDLEFL